MSQTKVPTMELCHVCGGSGAVGEVTQEMATDAGYGPEVVGQLIPCNYCGGDGWIQGVEIVETEEA